MKRKIFIMIIIITTLIAIYYDYTSKKNSNSLEKIKGTNYTYNTNYTSLDNIVNNRKKITFYKPLSINEMLKYLPNNMKEHIHIFNKSELPFEVKEIQGFIFTSKNDIYNKKNYDIQINYSGKNDIFFIVSVVQNESNPFEKYQDIKRSLDEFGNKISIAT